MANDNPDLWKEQVDRLAKEWAFQHQIKVQHLASLPAPDFSLAYQVEVLSKEVMPPAIKTLLFSTKEN